MNNNNNNKNLFCGAATLCSLYNFCITSFFSTRESTQSKICGCIQPHENKPQSRIHDRCQRHKISMPSHGLEWYKWVPNLYNPDGGVTDIQSQPTIGGASLNCHSFEHAWVHPLSYQAINHCRQSARDRQYRSDCGVKVCLSYIQLIHSRLGCNIHIHIQHLS